MSIGPVSVTPVVEIVGDDKLLLAFKIIKQYNGAWQLILTHAVGQPSAYAPRQDSEEIITDIHKLRIRLLELVRESDWQLVAGLAAGGRDITAVIDIAPKLRE